MEKIIVTRHGGLKKFLVQQGIVPQDTPVFEHADVATVNGKHVFGVLPLWLAAHAGLVTEVKLNLTPEMRGKELTVSEMETVFGGIASYEVNEIC